MKSSVSPRIKKTNSTTEMPLLGFTGACLLPVARLSMFEGQVTRGVLLLPQGIGDGSGPPAYWPPTYCEAVEGSERYVRVSDILGVSSLSLSIARSFWCIILLGTAPSSKMLVCLWVGDLV